MKRLLIAIVIATAGATPAFATDVGVSVNIGQPGFYGQIDIGDFPPPPVLYAQPIIIQRVHYDDRPLYLRVPPGHAKHWDKHCYEYNACNRPVLFVEDDWYIHEYAPRYQQLHSSYQYKDSHKKDKYGYNNNNHGNNGNGNGNGHY
jgi:hypothetical protein